MYVWVFESVGCCLFNVFGCYVGCFWKGLFLIEFVYLCNFELVRVYFIKCDFKFFLVLERCCWLVELNEKLVDVYKVMIKW